MKKIIIITLLLITGITPAQTNFEKGMTKAFELWSANKTDEAENLFERIANAETTSWLPNYYIAQINSIKSWNTKDETLLQTQLKKAQDHLDMAMDKSENNAELLVMQAQILTNWIAFDGMKYGMKYSAKVTELYNKALALDPNNPRAVSCMAQWKINSAKYFGQDVTAYCKELEASIELFDTFKAPSELYPNWGKGRAEETLKACKA
jgi:tetratricopeptide (TPR) repeat protein